MANKILFYIGKMKNNKNKGRFNMKKIVAIILAMIFTLSLSSCDDGKVKDFLLEKYQDTFFYGVKDISANRMKDNSYKIEIRCNDYRQCEVANVDNDQKAYCGERLLGVNTDLGKNIIQVQLLDSPYADEAFAAIYKPWTTYELSGSDNQLRFMYCYTPEHGVLLYIGSDSLKYYEQSLSTTMGSIVINVCNEESDS